MERVMVYFANGCKAAFDKQKVIFTGHDGVVFDFTSNTYGMQKYKDAVTDGKALINWDNVCYVQEIGECERDA